MGDNESAETGSKDQAGQAIHDPRLETIRSFLTRAFPEGTIPFPRQTKNDPSGTLHYAFNLKGWIKGDEPAILEQRTAENCLLSVWPLWPPDMFAAVATLMEQSGSYLRMIYCGEGPKAPISLDQFFDADQIVADTIARNSLCFDNRVLKVLRIVGALWREGCLFISGDGKENGDALDARVPSIIQNLQKNCRRALAELETHFHGEFADGEVSELSMKAVQWFKTKNLTSDAWPDDPDRICMNLSGTQEWKESELLLPQILESFLREKQQKEEYARPKLNDPVYPLNYSGRFEVVLCLWAIRLIESLWGKLSGEDSPYVLDMSRGPGSLKQWQVACTILLIISDDASRSLGFTAGSPREPLEGAKDNQRETTIGDGELAEVAIYENDIVGLDCPALWQIHSGLMIKTGIFPRNLARSVDESIATVMPKSRVPAAGCTIRSLSHNLALLPPKGRIRTRWAQQPAAVQVEDFPTFNLLLVPYPYEISSIDVTPHPEDDGDPAKEWGRFTVKPGWFERKPETIGRSGEKFENQADALEQFLKFVDALISDQPDGVINGLVFPEGALTTQVFEGLAQHILEHGTDTDDGAEAVTKARLRSITFLTAGLVDRKVKVRDQNGAPVLDNDGNPVVELESGNFVATYMRPRGGHHWSVQHTRSKHHRWSLNKPQLASYALSNRLSPDKIWWENINLPPREMLFAEFSRGSVLTSLICEDLARIDPCQAALRAVGPNLTLVLLMDSAQIVNRWPAQYAGVLADDPGTSVLTLTSFGLLRRANLSDGHTSRAIALWREPQAKGREIELPVGYHAQLLSLRRELQREVTVDGRGDGTSSRVWKLAGVVPIRVSSEQLPPGFPRN
jgi:hypothetical protein